MVAAAVGVASAAVGAAASSSAASKASKAQKRATDAQSAVADRQLQLAEDQWHRYLETYGPIEEQFVQESVDYGSEANRERAAAEAGGAVTANYANLRERLASTPGLDPSGQNYLNAMRKIGVSEAAQKAAAETGARTSVDDQARARMADAVSLGKGLPGNASAALSAAGNSYAGLASSAAAQGQAAGQQGASVARMFGDVLSNPSVQQGIGGLFRTTPVAAPAPAVGSNWAAMDPTDTVWGGGTP